ncbi:glutaminyl-peptide cyclotransferase-like [Denticeps clupeoides]|uniref:Glutaminyl-peptide cyclotransferase n=1 Tax=Denticeps clupeoides TaxID=299321 RepID=A0A8C3ZRI3_9TELE|nr:glutaminyl-peptide cyclotransferase-like [Denticeps clupeoides]XP_028822341.1 glutaminyl-peptide cyclotransferase-like [Denticeps clupeoides]
MSRSGRRNKPPHAGNGGAAPTCGPLRMPRARVLFFCLCAAFALALLLVLFLSNDASGSNAGIYAADLTRDKFSHKPTKVSVAQLHKLVSQVDVARLWEKNMRPFLIKRLPGSPGSQAVRQHIKSRLAALVTGWVVEEDSFLSLTPRGRVKFTNVLAVLDPLAPRRLLLACHYDSKSFPPDPKDPKRIFLGASDSAVPCSMILELVTALDAELKALKQQRAPVTLQLVFFDGEEAFEEWTDTDSLYGSRHLAELMAQTPYPPGSTKTSLLQSVDLLVLLDLLGGPDPLISNHFDNTAQWFDRLMAAEKRLHRQGLLSSHPSEQSYFRKDVYLGPVQDDHIPFLHRGVPVLHVIPTPFPTFWHTLDDTEEHMHRPTVENLTKILAVFLAEYLAL